METLLNFFGWFLSIAAVAGNGFVIGLVAQTRRLHSSSNWLVLSLAMADFGVGITVYPPGYFCNTSVSCNFRVYVAFFWFFLHSSVTNLCALTWDRYVAIVHPFQYSASTTARHPGMVILIAWLIPLAVALSLLVGTYTTQSNTVLKILRIISVSAFDIIFCALLLYAVVRILVVARAQSHQVSAVERHGQSNLSSMEAATSRRRRRHNTALFIIAIVVFFLGCYIVVSSIILCLTFSCQLSDAAGHVTTLLLVVNSAVNPLIYAFLKRDIKREVHKLICGEHQNERLNSTSFE